MSTSFKPIHGDYPFLFRGSLEEACDTAFHIGGTKGVRLDNSVLFIPHEGILVSCSACVYLPSRESIHKRGLQHTVCFKGDYLLSQYQLHCLAM